jgi:hypothetical protein
MILPGSTWARLSPHCSEGGVDGATGGVVVPAKVPGELGDQVLGRPNGVKVIDGLGHPAAEVLWRDAERSRVQRGCCRHPRAASSLSGAVKL